MTTKERVLAIRIMERQERNMKYLRKIGIQAKLVKKKAEVSSDDNT